jgi:chromosome segregation ATPase
MATNQDLIHICSRAIEAATELKAQAIKLAQLEQQIKDAENRLAGINAQIEHAKKLTPQLEVLGQQIRQKQSELADLQAVIAKKHSEHGSIDADLNSIIKKARALTAQPA